jgi:hypothetical protein
MTSDRPSRSVASCLISSANEGKADVLSFTLDSRLRPIADLLKIAKTANFSAETCYVLPS